MPGTFGLHDWSRYRQYLTGKNANSHRTNMRLPVAWMSDLAFLALSCEARGLLCQLVLLSGRYDNEIPADLTWLAAQCGTATVDLRPLLPWLDARGRALAASGPIPIETMPAPAPPPVVAPDPLPAPAQGTAVVPVQRPVLELELADTPKPMLMAGERLPVKRAKASEVVGVIQRLFLAVQSGTQQRLDAEQQREVSASIVFAYWAHRLDHQAAALDPERERRLLRRLEENHNNVAELLYVVDGALKDDWLMGRDPRSHGKRFDGIETIFRDRAQVEKLARAGGYTPGKQHPMAHKYMQLLAGGTDGQED